MKFALHAVGCGSTVKPDALAQVAEKAEELGFESVWIPEHLAVPMTMRSPYPYSADGKFPGGAQVGLHDPFIALAFVAARTTRLKLGTGVYVLPLRNAIAVAKSVASLDVLSNGRFLFGVGVGWLEDEFDAVGMPFGDRAARTREALRMMRKLWSEDAPSFEGNSIASRPSASTRSPCSSRTHRSCSAARAGSAAPRGRDRRRLDRGCAHAGDGAADPDRVARARGARRSVAGELRDHRRTDTGADDRPRRRPRLRRCRRTPLDRLQPRLRPAGAHRAGPVPAHAALCRNRDGGAHLSADCASVFGRCFYLALVARITPLAHVLSSDNCMSPANLSLPSRSFCAAFLMSMVVGVHAVPAQTETATPILFATPTASLTNTAGPSPTRTRTGTATATATRTDTPTRTFTLTRTPGNTHTQTERRPARRR